MKGLSSLEVAASAQRHIIAAMFALNEGLLDSGEVAEIINHQFTRLYAELAKVGQHPDPKPTDNA